MSVNHAFRLAKRPVGMPTPDTWDYVEEDIPQPGEGEVLVKVSHLSLDPAMRGWMNDARSYIPPVGIGEVMRALGGGEVIASNDPGFAFGDAVTTTTGLQEYAVVPARGTTKVDLSVAPMPVWMSALGMTGITAWLGVEEICKPAEGETHVVSGAAGAVGSVVGQILKIKGARVVGIAGGPEKCAYLTDELGFDAAIDYKAAENMATELRRACPDGIDGYFDNVGGELLDQVLVQLRKKARICICGAISQYNATAPPAGPANYLMLLVQNASMTGFTLFDYVKRFGEATQALAGWYAEGKLKSREDIVPGLETFPQTFLKLFSGENNGKLLLEVTG